MIDRSPLNGLKDVNVSLPIHVPHVKGMLVWMFSLDALPQHTASLQQNQEPGKSSKVANIERLIN